jgi:Ser/Thr protein kinase RdoA (MazF antagonist)
VANETGRQVRDAAFLGIGRERLPPRWSLVNEELRAVGAEFRIAGEFLRATPLGSGHIHQTFVAEYLHGGRVSQIVLQCLNTRIFQNPRALTENLHRITEHLRSKLVARGHSDCERRCLRPLANEEGDEIVIAASGAHWRAFPYIEGTRTVDQIESAAQAREAARAYAQFAADLADLPEPRLATPIPDFHDVAKRVRRLDEARRADPHRRAAAVTAESDAAARAWERIEGDLAAIGAADLPRRVMHNDCKLNNLLLDSKTGEGLCVIDLDTTMDATILCDFGELVRSGACRAAEDERDLAAIEFESELFEALAEGYMVGAYGFLSDLERTALPLAGGLLTLENAVRFLTDHLEGDVYFRTQREGQNLDRARAQLRLVESMLAAGDELRRIVERLSFRTSL